MGRLKSILYDVCVLSAFYCWGASPLSAQISLTKSVNVSTASSGSPITYTLNYSNANTSTTCSDTFEGDTLGAQPTGWTNSGGTWTTIADNGPTDPGTKAVQGVAATNTFPNFLNTCAGQVGDGSIQADMKISATGQTGVLLWRFMGTNSPTVVNGSNYQADIQPGTTNNVSVNYYDNGAGMFHNVATANFTITAGTWYTVLFQVAGTGTTATLALSINGTQVIAPIAANFAIGSGQAGLQSNSGSTVEFDNVSIIKLPQTYNVTVTDTLPAGLTYVSSSGAPTVTGQQVVWSLGNLAGGAAGALTVSGTVNNCGITLANTGEVNSALPFTSVISSAVTTTIAACTPTPTDTATNTSTPTPTDTPTSSSTLTATSTATFTPTNSFTSTDTPTGTSTATGTVTSTVTNTATSTASGTPTLTATNTVTDTDTFTETPTDTPSNSPTPTSTDTASSTATATVTDSYTNTATSTATSTPTGTPTLTVTNTATVTTTDTFTETFTDTASDTATPTATSTATFTSTSTPTDTVTSTATATPTDSPIDTPTNTETSTASGTATNTASPTITNTPSNTTTPTSTDTFTETATDTPSNTPISTPTYTATSTATATSTDTLMNTATNTVSGTPTATATLTATDTVTNTFTETATDTLSNTPTTTPMDTETFTATATPTDTFMDTATNTATSTPTGTLTSTVSNTATSTSTQTDTDTPSNTFTSTATSTVTTTPTNTLPNTATNTVTSTLTGTPTSTVSNTATSTSTETTTNTPVTIFLSTATYTRTSTVTATPTATASPSSTPTPPIGTATLTPTASVTVSCAAEMINIFDQQGELVKSLCGMLGGLPSQNLNLTVSSFVPNASGLGGSFVFFLNGKTLATWDTTNNNGVVVPNGFYHLVVTQVFTGGTSAQLQTTLYVGTLSRTAPVQLSAQPNIVTSGGTIRLLATVDGLPVTGNRVLKLYDTNRERVKTLDMSGGQAVWDLTNSAGQDVSSGLYLIVLDTVDPQTGNPAQKVIKVVVLR